MTTTTNKKPTRNADTIFKRFGTEIVTLNTETRQYHVLNDAAAVVEGAGS